MTGNTPTLETIQALVEDQGRTFEEFKTANDAAIAEMKATGSVDPVLTETVDKANTKLGELATEMDKIIADRKAEDEAQAAKIVELEAAITTGAARADMLETTLKRTPRGDGDKDPEVLERKGAAEFFTVRASTANAANEVRAEDLTDDQVEEFRAYSKAFREYIRRSPDSFGQGLGVDVAKALSVGIEADGGYWVIPEISNRVMARVFETSPIRPIATVVTIGTDAIEFPTDTNDAVLGGWVGEKGARAESATPQVGQGRISVHEQFANPRATQKLLDDAQFPVEQWLANKIADKLARTENTAFVVGDGEAKPRGFMDYSGAAVTTADSSRAWGLLQYTATGNAAAFAADPNGPDALIDVIHDMNPIFRARARWVANRATMGVIRKMQDSNGMYIWQMGNMQVGQPSQILGFGITEAEDMADIAANAYPVAFGDFTEGYMVVDRAGIRTLRDPFSAKPFVQFYTTKRVGGDVTNFDAIKLIKMEA